MCCYRPDGDFKKVRYNQNVRRRKGSGLLSDFKSAVWNGTDGLTDGIRNEAKEQRWRARERGEKEGERIVVGEDVSGS